MKAMTFRTTPSVLPLKREVGVEVAEELEQDHVKITLVPSTIPMSTMPPWHSLLLNSRPGTSLWSNRHIQVSQPTGLRHLCLLSKLLAWVLVLRKAYSTHPYPLLMERG